MGDVPSAYQRAKQAESRLREALGIVDDVAAVLRLANPAHALALLTEDEQVRLYSLLKGESE